MSILKECFQRHKEQTPRGNRHDIFKYYNVPNEIKFINRQEISREISEFYVKENVYRFLEEFAGQVPYTPPLSFIMKDESLTYAGINLTDSYRSTSQNGQRERDDYVGYLKVQKALADGAESVAWISPPKTHNYGFVYYFTRNPHDPSKIREHILRYDEQRGDLSVSRSIRKKMLKTDIDDPRFRTDSDFLQRPINPHPNTDLSAVMAAAGIDERQIQLSHHFVERVRAQLDPWVNLYSDAVHLGDVEVAEKLLQAIYNIAYDMHVNHTHADRLDRTSPPIDYEAIKYFSTQKRAVPTGSCPVSQNNWTNPLSFTNIIDSLLNKGTTINGINSEAQHFICPKCDFHATGPVGNVCPGCNLTKEDYVKEAAKNGVEIC